MASWQGVDLVAITFCPLWVTPHATKSAALGWCRADVVGVAVLVWVVVVVTGVCTVPLVVMVRATPVMVKELLPEPQFRVDERSSHVTDPRNTFWLSRNGTRRSGCAWSNMP